jgi:hypothetical protein
LFEFEKNSGSAVFESGKEKLPEQKKNYQNKKNNSEFVTALKIYAPSPSHFFTTDRLFKYVCSQDIIYFSFHIINLFLGHTFLQQYMLIPHFMKTQLLP